MNNLNPKNLKIMSKESEIFNPGNRSQYIYNFKCEKILNLGAIDNFSLNKLAEEAFKRDFLIYQQMRKKYS